jgi:pilus assembly protein CpaD
VRELRLIAHRNGVGPERIRQVPRGGHVVTMSYDRIAALGPTCGAWGEDVSRNPHNLPYPNYGCATQRNLAAMAANPTDLMYPALETPRGSDTRETDRKTFNQSIGKPIQNTGSTAGR